jgi:hypothetical protein
MATAEIWEVMSDKFNAAEFMLNTFFLRRKHTVGILIICNIFDIDTIKMMS